MSKPADGADDSLEVEANYDPNGPDHGLMELKSEAELAEQMRERGFQFSYACYQDGNPDACHSLGQWLSMWRKLPAEGAAVFKHNCDRHNQAESCFKYANYKRNGPLGQSAPAGSGDGRQQLLDCDPVEADAYYEKACNQLQHRRSCLSLGRSRLLSKAPDSQDAGLALLQRGCLGPGDSEGAGVTCVSAAIEFLRVNRLAEARRVASAACDFGDGVGCGLLAKMMRRGDGGPADAQEADRLAQRAKDLPSEYGRFLQQAKGQHLRTSSSANGGRQPTK